MRKHVFLWAVVLLGLGQSHEATSQELESLEGLQGGLAPLESGLEPLANPFAPAEVKQVLVEQQKAADEERARWLSINHNIASNALILKQQRHEKARGDSAFYVGWWAKQSGGGTTNEGGIGLRRTYASSYRRATPMIPFPVNGSELDRFMWAMAHKKESGGRYDAYNPSGAYGKYQYLPSTWNNAAREYSQDTGIPLSLVITQDAFNQERVTRHQMTKLFGQYGNWRDVASVWFSGRPYYAHKNPDAIKDAMGTTVKNYCDTILRAMQTGQ